MSVADCKVCNLTGIALGPVVCCCSLVQAGMRTDISSIAVLNTGREDGRGFFIMVVEMNDRLKEIPPTLFRYKFTQHYTDLPFGCSAISQFFRLEGRVGWALVGAATILQSTKRWVSAVKLSLLPVISYSERGLGK